jgi:hypothetical protein
MGDRDDAHADRTAAAARINAHAPPLGRRQLSDHSAARHPRLALGELEQAASAVLVVRHALSAPTVDRRGGHGEERSDLLFR